MAAITVEGDINRVTWNDRMVAAPRIDSRVRRVRGKWVTIPARAATMTDWRAASARITHH